MSYNPMLYIPVRRHHGLFDDFFRNRWLELHTPRLSTEMERRRQEWEDMLGDARSSFLDFSPMDDLVSHHHESDGLIQTGPSGKPEFAVRFNVKHFKPEEVEVSTKDGRLTVAATHEEKTENSSSRREFKRTLDIPEDVQIDLMKSTLSKDGILSITAPVKPPQLTQGTVDAIADGVVTKQSEAGDAINYSLSIAGYKPEEVAVTLEDRRVTVHAKCEEDKDGRKVRSEMVKSFDLPPTVDPDHVRSYIKDGSTLFVEARMRDDLAGKIHLVPITNKHSAALGASAASGDA